MNKKYLLLIPCLLLASCGSTIEKIAEPYARDHSGNWADNYYTHFDEALKTREVEEVELNMITNKVFVSFASGYFNKYEELAGNMDNYYDDFAPTGFGQQRKMANYHESFKEGFVSKLFDGQLFCHQYYELSRVQIKEEGFSYHLYKPLESADYLYLNFKAAVDFKTYPTVVAHRSKIKVHITLYGETNRRYTYFIENMNTNAGESYMFYGFPLTDFDIKGTTDFAISYTLVDDPAIDEDPNAQYALLLYEFGFKNPVFQ